ncbi:hypothetical protein BDR22DRAFT_891864 [Usnea florida]
MLVGNQGRHRILGRMYSDEQLFRIIVPKRFTLHAHPPKSQVEAGFSNSVILTSGDIRPDFTNEDIALVLQYCWPEEFGDLKACDIDAVDNSVKGVGNNLESEADILSYDDVALSDYCHDKLYNDKVRRGEILDSFKVELHEAQRLRATAVEERFKWTDPGVLQYIIIARLHHALPWDSIAESLNRRYTRRASLMGQFNEFDSGLVEEIYQLHAEARTSTYEECESRDWKKLSMARMPTGKMRREAQIKARFSPITPAAMTLAESQGKNWEHDRGKKTRE